MTITRRHFSMGALTALLAGCGKGDAATAIPGDVAPGPGKNPEPASGPTKVLILGGTGFLGPALVEASQALGAEVTLFNRGKTNPHLFPELEKLRGDRNDDLSSLKGRRWDWVLDTSGYFPRQVEASAGLLADNVDRYLFVSSISAYADLSKPGVDESSPAAAMPDPYSEEMPTYYGPLKAGCERAALEAMPGRAVVVRPGLIVGPGDPTDRFTYWPVRIARGGEVLAPNAPSDPLQFIDVRDLAAFMVRTMADGRDGIYNATGPATPMPVGELLQACKQVTGSDASFVWAPTAFLAEQEVAPWMELTVWVPSDDEQFGGMGRVSIERALQAGLTFRPAEETVADTLAWWEGLPAERRERPRAGLSSERETKVLAAWKERDAGKTAA